MAGFWVIGVWVGNGVDEGTMAGNDVLNCGSNEVLVGEGTNGGFAVEPGTLV